MTVNFKKVKRVVIDVNCIVSVFINRATERLVRYLSQNTIEVFYDTLLKAELVRVLNYAKIKKILPLKTELYVAILELIGTEITANKFDVQSPDKDDCYLYDIALTANAKLLVTGDKALLQWQDSPVDTMSLAHFMEQY